MSKRGKAIMSFLLTCREPGALVRTNALVWDVARREKSVRAKNFLFAANVNRRRGLAGRLPRRLHAHVHDSGR